MDVNDLEELAAQPYLTTQCHTQDKGNCTVGWDDSKYKDKFNAAGADAPFQTHLYILISNISLFHITVNLHICVPFPKIHKLDIALLISTGFHCCYLAGFLCKRNWNHS
jgi:hypothetical protein